jgi:hypothetical protein
MENVGIFYGHILQTFGTFYCPLVHFVLDLFIFLRFGALCVEKPGNPGQD